MLHTLPAIEVNATEPEATMRSRAQAASCRLQAQAGVPPAVVPCGVWQRLQVAPVPQVVRLNTQPETETIAETLMRRVRLCYICWSRRVTCSAARLPLQPLARESCCMAAVPQVVWHNPQRIPLHACGRHACCVATRMTTECEATITPMRICFTPTQICSRPRTHPCLDPSAQLNDHARRATERDHCAYI